MTSPLYKPPTKVKTITIPFRAMVQRSDPGFEAARRNEVFYEFTGRTFRGDNTKKGAYASRQS